MLFHEYNVHVRIFLQMKYSLNSLHFVDCQSVVNLQGDLRSSRVPVVIAKQTKVNRQSKKNCPPIYLHNTHTINHITVGHTVQRLLFKDLVVTIHQKMDHLLF